MTPHESSSRRVLVVDDDADIRTLISEYLALHGLEVLEATNGLEALLHFKRSRPSGVVLDLRMPRLGGLDALKRMVAFDPAVRVVVVTGEVDAELRRQALKLGARAVLPKPVALPDLLASLELPSEPTTPVATNRRLEPVAPSVAPSRAAKAGRVLVVDDDREMRAMLEEFLTTKGYDTRSVADGAAAIRAIVEAPPDAVFLDIDMPGLRGIDALPAIAAVAPNTKVIMVSGTTDAEVAKGALAHGAFDYVVKPVDFAYLSHSLDSAIAMKDAETSP
jgi:DNA-binding NtrC family response regulator